METTDKKGPKSFSLTKGEYGEVVARAKHHGMDNPAEYLLALMAFDKTHSLRTDWNIVRGKATLVADDFQLQAAEPASGEGHPVQTDPNAIAHAAHPDSALYTKKKPPRRKAKGSSAPK
jgi:hypothetical protein